MIAVLPGASFEWLFGGFGTGLGTAGTGALGVRIRDGAGADFLARSTSAIVEDVTVGTKGVYRRAFTAPASAGQFWLIADDGTSTVQEELRVTSDGAVGVLGAGSLYVTRDEIKTILGIEASDFADLAIDIAVEAACRAVDGYKGVRYYATAETRYYTVDRYARSFTIDPLATLTSLSIDTDDDGNYDTVWTQGTDFVLTPRNASLTGEPYTTVELLRRGNRRFSGYQQAVKIEGGFGWAAAPGLVKQAAVLLANRFLTRTRQAPLGVLVASAADAVATARLGLIDPDAQFLLDQLPSTSRGPLTSLQLG